MLIMATLGMLIACGGDNDNSGENNGNDGNNNGGVDPVFALSASVSSLNFGEQ